jgi:hypothetical protein
MAYPFQTTGWESGQITGVGSQMGGSTTYPSPSVLGQAADLGLSGTALLGGTGAFGSAGWLAPAVAALARGGSVADRSKTVPESARTLRAQQKQLIAGHRRVQMFPEGSTELSVPHGMARLAVGSDVFHYNPRRIDAATIRSKTEQGHEHELLDLGPYSKHEILERARGGEIPLAVVERDPEGTELRAAAGTHRTAHEQRAAMERTMSPGHRISFEDPRVVLAQRRANGGAVQHLDTGGVAGAPYSSSGAPYSGASGYVPQSSGSQARPWQGPSMPYQPETATQMFQNAAGMVKGLGIKPNASANNPSGGGAGLFGPGNGSGSQGMGGWTSTTPDIGSSGVSWGGSSTPDVSAGSSSYGYMNRGGVARKRGGYVRAGLGLSSFVPRLADGGTPDDAITMPQASFDDRFNAVDPGGTTVIPEAPPLAGLQPASFDDRFNAATAPQAGLGASAPPQAPGADATPAPQAGIGLGAAVPLPQPRPAGAPIAGLQMDLPPEITSGQSPGAAPPQQPQQFDRFVNAIAHNETGAERDPYHSVISTGTGHRVYGKYQVFDENIPKWTQQALGHPMTPQQFLASP